MDKEIWRDIPGYEGAYQASSLGRVRSLDRVIVQMSRWGLPFTRKMKGRVLRPAATRRDPHLYVTLGHGASGSPVHQLVARAFLGVCPAGEEVRHLDGDAANNKVSNLCYGSRTDNILDVYRQNGKWRKLSLKEIREIQRHMNSGACGAAIAREYGVSGATVSKIKLGGYKSCTI